MTTETDNKQRHSPTFYQVMSLRLGPRAKAKLLLMENLDPLLPLPDATLELPKDLPSEERLKAVFIAVRDYINLHAMAWPARNKEGDLLPPPDEHILHELAHRYNLVDEESLLTNPSLGDVGVVSELPDCDYCGREARYDAIVEINGAKGGAYLCGDHYLEHGSGTLGASGDAYLMLESEVPQWVQDVCNQLLSKQGRAPVF